MSNRKTSRIDLSKHEISENFNALSYSYPFRLNIPVKFFDIINNALPPGISTESFNGRLNLIIEDRNQLTNFMKNLTRDYKNGIEQIEIIIQAIVGSKKK